MKDQMSRRKFLQLASMSAAGVVLASCAPAAAPAASGDKPADVPAAGEKKTITFTMFGHPGLIEQMAPKFNETHPNVEVKFERSEGQGYDEKLAAALAGGSAWDCFRTTPANCLRWGSKGAVIDLKPFHVADTTYPADGYLPGFLDAYADLSLSKRFGMPVWNSNFWLYYNKKLFDEAGVAYPTADTTWEQYVDMCKKLTKTDSSGMITQYGAANWGSWWAPDAQVAWSAGGHFYYNDDYTQIKMDDPETIAAMQAQADLMNEYKVHPSPLNPPSTPATIMSGKVATEVNGDWYPWDQKDTWKEEFDAVQCPLVTGKRVNVAFADPLVINASSKNADAAYQWLSWFACDPEAIAFQGRVVFPVFTKAYTDETIMKSWLQAPRPESMIKTALDHSKVQRIWRVEPHAPEFENTIFTPELEKLWRNVAKAEEVCKTITDKGNELMAKPVA